MSLSADDQAQIIGIGAVVLLGLCGGIWRTATLRGDQNARWASRVDLAVAALDEKTITQLELLREEVNKALPPPEEQPGFSPLAVIADLAPLRAYPCRAVAVRAVCARLRAIMPLASWRSARWFSSFLDQRMSIARLRFSQE